MKLGVFARNLFVDWFGGSTRTNRELLIRLANRRGVEVDFIPVVDEVYWRFRGKSGFRDMVLKWVETYGKLGIHIHNLLIDYYISGDLHKTWGELSSGILKDYDLVYDPILMPMANPRLLNQISQIVGPGHYLLDCLKANRDGKALALVIGSGDVPLSLAWGFRFAREYLFDDFRRTVGIELFILRVKSLFDALNKFKDRLIYLIPSTGLIRKIPQLRGARYFLFFPFYAVDDRVKAVSVGRKGDYVIFFSRLDLTKGILNLPSIVYYMSKYGCGVEVKVVGGFEDKATERAFWRRVNSLDVGKFIDFVGFVPEERKVEAYRLLSSARVMIYPSHVDVVPNVVVESLFLGTPVVMYGIPGPREVFEGTRAIRFVPEFDVKSMAREVCLLLNSDEDPIDDKALSIVKAHSDWGPIVDRFIGILHSITD
ncbi:glycosyltransferase [Vulcanisaeta distributa]|uniref:Glycosyl transferase group 1 n=1 Tax=Vulcanisaeta distributa (strain DSM 14429 / JCM 11212 / NBRC 100878 / IC-017) TaxID=572478 RepID=E1QUD1_VULDI|nr:glycosyltransferase [Vulcanisaeta distributa]ADN49857.1 glycosyl transferase group 1 [Vulcanisaeta distributa DSM 14429]